MFGTAFIYIPREYQWLLALISPLIREFFVRFSLEISYKSAGNGSRGAYSVKFPCMHYMESRHATVLAIILGGVATQTSSYCIIGMDFAINIYHGLKIVYRFKQEGNISKEQGDLFMILWVFFSNSLTILKQKLNL